MLKCKDIANGITDYLEDNLSWGTKFQFRLHFMMCNICHRYLNQMRQTIKLLKRAPGVAPARDQEEQMVARFTESRRRP